MALLVDATVATVVVVVRAAFPTKEDDGLGRRLPLLLRADLRAELVPWLLLGDGGDDDDDDAGGRLRGEGGRIDDVVVVAALLLNKEKAGSVAASGKVTMATGSNVDNTSIASSKC